MRIQAIAVMSFISLTSELPGQIQKPVISPSSLPASGGITVPVLSPIPIYPGSAVAANTFPSNFLFLDPKSRELVISYPDNVDSPAYPQSPGPRQEVRVQLKRDISAMVYVSFGADVLGRTIYTYTLVNQSDAKQDLSFFSLPVPSPGSNVPGVSVNAPSVVGSAGWGATVSQPDKSIVHVTWSQPGLNGIRAGGMLGGFTVASVLKPGFVSATAKGTSTSPNFNALNVPSRVHQTLAALEDSGFNERAVLTIGPQFPSDTNLLRMVLNFREGLVALEQHGYIKSSSPFLIEAKDVLTRYLEGARFAVDGPAADYSGPSLALKAKPTAGLETQSYQAMKLSLGIN